MDDLFEAIPIRPRAWGAVHTGTAQAGGPERLQVSGAGTDSAGLTMDSLDLLARLGLQGLTRVIPMELPIHQITSGVSTLYLADPVFGSLAMAIAGSLSDTGFVFILEEFENAPVASYGTIGNLWTRGEAAGNIQVGGLKATSTIGQGASQTHQPVLGEIFMGGLKLWLRGISVLRHTDLRFQNIFTVATILAGDWGSKP